MALVYYDSNQQRLIIDRGWLIYNLISSKFSTPGHFHIKYPSIVENALISGYFQMTVEIDHNGYLLKVHEEYEFRDYNILIKHYSYNLLDKDKNNIIRADSLPHHKVDYKGKKLSDFPHHLHDKKGRICQFSGKFDDFIEKSLSILTNTKL